MINLTLKKKIIIFAIALILLIIGCLITGILGLHLVQISKDEAEIAVNIHDNFDELRILFEQTLMGPHDYLIQGNQDENRFGRAMDPTFESKNGECETKRQGNHGSGAEILHIGDPHVGLQAQSQVEQALEYRPDRAGHAYQG